MLICSQSILKMCLISLLLPAVNAVADDNADLADLMAFLDAQTDIATQTKMNADFVPGMVTILHGDKLAQLGIETSGEALGLVPGIYHTRGNEGHMVSIVRGTGVTLKSSNLKILLNGKAMNSAVTGTADPVLNLPVHQIDRIEVVRGPGSSVYGEFAFSGVVNIITRKGTPSVHVKLGSYQYKQLDVVTGSFNKESEVNWSLNLSAWDTDGSQIESGPDNFFDRGLGHAPGDIFDEKKGASVILDSQLSGFKLLTQYITTQRGGYFGRLGKSAVALEPAKESILDVSLSKDFEITSRLSAQLSASYHENKNEQAEFMGLPAGATIPGSGGQLVPEDDFRQDAANDSTQEINSTFDWQGLPSHNIHMSFGFTKYEVDKAYGTQFGLDLTATEVRVVEGTTRELIHVSLQDQWMAQDDIEVTYGARLDKYDDWGSRTSPRFGVVWRATGSHIVKAQYSEAFRPPTLEEAYPGANSASGGAVSLDITAEEITSSELSYIYRQPIRTIKATLFETNISDLISFNIVPRQSGAWINKGEVKTYGIELEWAEDLAHDLAINSNISYVKTNHNEDEDGDYIGSVGTLANIAITSTMFDAFEQSLLIKYVGTQEGFEFFYANNNRYHDELFDAYTTVNYVLSSKNLLGITGLNAQLSVNNIFDEQWSVQESPYQWPEGLTQGGISSFVDVSYDL